MTTWYEECPERLEYELRALTEAGLPTTVDAAARDAGQLVLAVRCPIDGIEHVMRVVFPQDYPYFAFAVYAPSLSLARHQDPYSKLLCFRARIDTEWRSHDTVAEYLTDRLPLILAANNSDAAYEGEGHEGAPVTGYLQFAPESVVLLGDWTVPPDQSAGTLVMGVEKNNNPHVIFRGAVLQVKDAAGNVVGELEPSLRGMFERTFNARWIRLPEKPKSDDPNAIMREAIAHSPELKKCAFNGDAPDVIGIVFPDEARYRELHDIWIFIVRRSDRQLPPSKSGRRPPGDKISIYLARPDHATRNNLQARAPRLRPLTPKKAAVFGLGALGSMACWQLARAGLGRLALIDHDVVSSGTISRWLLGLLAAGRYKATILQAYINQSYPQVEIEPFVYRIGFAGTRPTDVQQVMTRALDGADIIVDCTAEFTVHHYLSSIARRRGIPYVWVSARSGGWGGVVGRVIPDRTAGCWGCFYRHRTDGTFPSPAQEDAPDIQPVGCFSPTFTGAGFDMDLVSIMAVRLAVSTLCRCEEESYPDFDWDVGIVDLWNNGRPIAPDWKTFSLTRHAECDLHQ